MGSGIVDVSVVTSAGGEGYLPEAWSYGPNVEEITDSYVTADAGATLNVFGLGLSPGGNGTDLTATVGNQSAKVAGYTAANSLAELPPVANLTLPAAVAGTSENVTLRNSLGSATLSAALAVLPSVKRYLSPERR